MKSKRVWVIGLDGAPWSLLRPWAEAGLLPTLVRLMKDGAWGDLESTIQPLTACAWSTFITGTNPGQHGLFDFTRRVPGTYQVEVVNGGMRRGASLWRVLSDAGRRVGVINVPMTYPPEPVNGYLVAGLDTPGLHSPYTYPPSLAAEIADEHLITVSTAGVTHAEYLARTLDAVDRRFRVLRRLLDREPVDFMMKVIMETDAIQHCSWHLLSQPDAPGHDAILQVYQCVDQRLGELLNDMPDGTTLVMMSDHGAGPIDKVVYLDRWLASEGWLQFKAPGASTWKATATQRAVGLAQRYLPQRVKAALRGRMGARAQVEAVLRFGAVDWRHTRAFAWGNQGNIILNLAGREPEGIVQPGAEAERLTDEIIERLYALRDPESGEPVVERVYRREEIYNGPMVPLAPDLLIRWKEDRYVAKTLYHSQHDGPIFGKELKFGRAGSTHVLDQTGTHTLYGICLLYGAGVRSGAHIQGARLMDLAPTILHLMDVPIPEQMEGRVLDEALESEAEPSHVEEVSLTAPKPAAAPAVVTSDRRPRVMVLGLDGGTWDLLDRLIAQGHMPNLAALRERSAWGRLHSTTPPFSATAWTSFLTGVNPGKHGIFDFWWGRGGGGTRRPISSGMIGVPPMWTRLTQAGRRSAFLNVPVTYPPQPHNGITISGMLTPSEDASYTYPPELKAQLREAIGAYRANPYAAITQSKSFLREALYWVKQREKANRWLWERERWDLFVNVIQAPDPIQHYFWTFLQPDHPDYNAPGAAEFRELALEVFHEIDEIIGQRVELLDEDTTLLIMSDHGAGEATHWFNLNRWLSEHGWLTLHAPAVKQGLSRIGIDQARVLNALRRLDRFNLRGRVNNLARARLRDRLDRMVAPEIDWTRTLAYSGSPSAESIYLNVAGREPYGIVQPGAEYERLRDEIAQALLELRGPDGKPVVEAVYRREELYHGRFLDMAPDLILAFGERPYLVSEGLSGAELFQPIPFEAARGRHRPYGILLAYGRGVDTPGQRQGAEIIDIAPTILRLLELPMPAELDGRALSDWLTLPEAKQAVTSEAESTPSASSGDAYSEEDVAAIEERLRSLGYLD
ncbi:MAG: alkaline phosphatase family protein [Anaerolineae bacterium]|nr:alkaline phosphatase family protein [Anaerolineae bacterium]